MKKWIRNLALGLGIAAVGAGYTVYKYDNYSKLHYTSLKYDPKTEEKVLTYRLQDNAFFESIHKKFGIFGRKGEGKEGTITLPMTFHGHTIKGNVLLNESSMKKDAVSIENLWEEIEANSKLKKGDPRWRADFQLDWEMFKNVPESERYDAVYNSIERRLIDHEDDHMRLSMNPDYLKNVKIEDQEKLASSRSAMDNLMEIEYMESIKRGAYGKKFEEMDPNEIASAVVTYKIMKKLGKDSKYDLYHIPGLENKLKKAAREVNEDLRKELKVNY